jgi:hypothetical protein
MRQSIVFAAVLTSLALAADMVPATAQTAPTVRTAQTVRSSAYDYPWCLQGAKSSYLSCYFNNWDECMTSKSGLGGHCTRSPFYRGPIQ